MKASELVERISTGIEMHGDGEIMLNGEVIEIEKFTAKQRRKSGEILIDIIVPSMMTPRQKKIAILKEELRKLEEKVKEEEGE